MESKLVKGIASALLAPLSDSTPAEAWIYRDDIGAPLGIKGYEEQVNTVGMHHGHNHWPSELTWNTYNSATIRRGFKVWQRAC